jgi:hypothetical protein
VTEKAGTPPHHGNPGIMKHFIKAAGEPNGTHQVLDSEPQRRFVMGPQLAKTHEVFRNNPGIGPWTVADRWGGGKPGDVWADGRVHVTHGKVGEGIGQSMTQSEHSKHESNESCNQWNRGDESTLGDGLPVRPKTVERRDGRSMKEEERKKRIDRIECEGHCRLRKV